MTDAESPPDEQETPATRSANVDALLVELLNQMESFGFSHELTLMVQGFVVSGIPIFMAEYLERHGVLAERSLNASAELQSDSVKAESHRKLGRALRAWYTDNIESLQIPRAPEGDDEAQARRRAVQDEIMKLDRQSIMLKRVVLISSSGDQMDLPFWRGRLSHVSGWWVSHGDLPEYEGPDPDE